MEEIEEVSSLGVELLDENASLIQTIVDLQNLGRVQEAAEYQQTLHRNLVYLANIADDTQTLLAELQMPPGQNPRQDGQGQPVSIEKPTNGTPYYGTDAQQTGQYQQQPVVVPTSVQQSNAPAPMGPPQMPQMSHQPPAPVSYSHQQPQSAGPTPQTYGSSGAYAQQPPVSQHPPSYAAGGPQQASGAPQHLYSQASAQVAPQAGPSANLYSQAGSQQPTLYSQAAPQVSPQQQVTGPPPHLYSQAGPQAAGQIYQQQQYYHSQYQQQPAFGTSGPQGQPLYQHAPRSQQQLPQQNLNPDGAYYITQNSQQRYQQAGPVVVQPQHQQQAGGHSHVMYQQANYQQQPQAPVASYNNQQAQPTISRGGAQYSGQQSSLVPQQPPTDMQPQQPPQAYNVNYQQGQQQMYQQPQAAYQQQQHHQAQAQQHQNYAN